MNLKIEVIFFSVLGVCGVLLALRAVVSVLRGLRDERAREQRRAADLVAEILRPPGREPEPQAAPTFVPIVPAVDLEEGEAEKPGGLRGLRGRLANYTLGLAGKMIFTFVGIVAAFGLTTLAWVYFTLGSSLSRHIMQRASVMALNISDGASGYLVKNDAAGLRELLRKSANRPELAYILVENRAGEIFAHSFAVLPQEIRARSLGDRAAVESQGRLKVGDGEVYEVSVPILEGRSGVVRVGIWREQVDAEINESVMPVIKPLAWIVCGAILAVVFLAWHINRPIFKLVAAAKAISSGDLDVSAPRVEDATEFGELSRALERMRSSLKAAMSRLSR